MRATALFAVSLLSIAAVGCGGPASELSNLICDCEHCNDWDEEETLDGFKTEQDIADAYGCSDQWDDYMNCQIDEGRCDETQSNWTSNGPGSCSSTLDLGTPCMTSADCNGGPGTQTCSAMMTCVTTACAGGGGPCDTNADCPGSDPCQSKQDRLSECVQKGSAHQGPGGP
jgi:hypothetical protein